MKKDVSTFVLFCFFLSSVSREIYISIKIPRTRYICIYNVLIVSGLIFQSARRPEPVIISADTFFSFLLHPRHSLHVDSSPETPIVIIDANHHESCLESRRMRWFVGGSQLDDHDATSIYKCCCSSADAADEISADLCKFYPPSLLPPPPRVCLCLCVVIMASTDAPVMDSISTQLPAARIFHITLFFVSLWLLFDFFFFSSCCCFAFRISFTWIIRRRRATLESVGLGLPSVIVTITGWCFRARRRTH